MSDEPKKYTIWNEGEQCYEEVSFAPHYQPVNQEPPPKKPSRDLPRDYEKHMEWIRLLGEGFSVRQVAAMKGVTPDAVYKAKSRWKARRIPEAPKHRTIEPPEPPEEQQSRIKFRLVKRMSETLKIRDKSAQIVWFVANYAQRCLDALVVAAWYLGVAVVFNILKSRQEGYSTRIEGYCYTWTKDLPNEDTLLAAHAKDNTLIVLDITKRFHNEDPDKGIHGGEFKKERLEYDISHGSKIRIVTAETEDSGASATTRKIHNSEFGLFKKAPGYWGTLYPSWPATPGSFIFNETTGRPEALFFKKLFDAGFRHDPSRPSKTFLYLLDCLYKGVPAHISIFDSWIYHKADEIPLLPNESIDDWDLDERELKLIEEFPILQENPAKLKWFHFKYEGMNRDWDRMMTEFPLDPEHPFQFYGGPAYNQVVLSRLLEECLKTKPLFRGDIDFDPDYAIGKPKLKQNPFGKLLVFQDPLPDYLYVLGVDFAQGTGAGDFNEIVVGRVPHPGEKRRVVAHWRTNERGVGPGMTAVIAWLIGKYYGKFGNIPLMIPERPAVNQAGIEILLEGHAKYPKMSAPWPLLFSYKQRDADGKEEREEYGFQTTAGAKESSINRLAMEIEADNYVIESEVLLRQLMGFSEDPAKTGKGRWVQRYIDSETNKPHDDAESACRMMNYGIDWVLENDIPVLERIG